ncbi:polyphosphate kinase 2 family protein [Tumebacillus permanentifrigoris]|uniref:Polyphosphate kinase 2 (PPK2 family) n=1 Tax=Tumebacillus permanentifrigoris TaxID=378543 RepID=A0A316D6N5_9BACL|nr:hypothetical protein [Tumebacillus permanentifrigoris]PWK07438.1 polyphosphate kinase 2 (PPK2 family) [Tumebacillus permanentifrigoris]
MNLQSVDLSVALEKKEYEDLLKTYQLQLVGLQRKLVEKRIPLVLVFEGWDASGKGGAIKRLTEKLDPRGFQVHPIAAPNDVEREHHYLWRFFTRLPQRGAISIFDRSWYGRVLVERVEKFATQAEWQRAYTEINQLEKMLTDDGALVFKFWLHLSKEEQFRRFKDRESDPLKAWKITEEDWRNRERWDDYVEAAQEMFAQTNTDYAPWTLVAAENKKYARIQVLKTVIDGIQAALKKSERH